MFAMSDIVIWCAPMSNVKWFTLCLVLYFVFALTSQIVLLVTIVRIADTQLKFQDTKIDVSEHILTHDSQTFESESPSPSKMIETENSEDEQSFGSRVFQSCSSSKISIPEQELNIYRTLLVKSQKLKDKVDF